MRKTIIILAAVILVLLPVTTDADTGAYWRGLDELGRTMTFRDSQYSDTEGLSIWETAPLLAGLDPGTAFSFFEEFYNGTVDSTVVWQWTADVGTHTKAVADSLGGLLKIEAKTTDNNECYIYGRGEPIRFRADKPFWFEAEVRVAAVADSTYADNIIVGIMSAGGANTLQDNGAGPPANYDGAVFYIPDQPGTGSTYWNTETSTTTSQETTNSVLARTAATWYTLSIIWDGDDSVYFYIDGVLEATHTTYYANDNTSCTFVAGCKTGVAGTTGLEVDYIKFMQVR